jgi:hypothetical protein
MQNETSSVPAAAAPEPVWMPWLRAASHLDPTTWLAMLCIVIGWFLLNTLAVSLGPINHAFRFYDMLAIIDNPMQLFVGIKPVHYFEVTLFTLVCAGALCAPVMPYVRNDRTSWLAYLVPLLLMVVADLWLYVRTSGDFFATPAEAGTLSSDVIHFANDLLHRGSEPIARRVTIGAGSYLAIVGGVVLAIRGIRGYRGQIPAPREPLTTGTT